MKKLLTALFATAAIAVSAQTARSGNSNWAIEFPKDGKAINVTQTFTPFFKIENEERVINMSLNERDMNNAKHWLSVDVAFSTHAVAKGVTQWPKWLDDVEVEINVFLPIIDDRGNVNMGVIGGKQKLASLQANEGRHFVRMMIPPEVIYRYFVIDGAAADPAKDYAKITTELKKLAADIPVMAAVTYGGRTVYGFQTCGKNTFSLLERNQSSNSRAKLFYTLLKAGEGNPTAETTAKLFNYITQNKYNPQTFKYMPDELLPVSKTPFAWVLFDRFEPIKESAGK